VKKQRSQFDQKNIDFVILMVMLLLKENPTTKLKMNYSFSQKKDFSQTNKHNTKKTLKFKKQPPNLTSNLRLKT